MAAKEDFLGELHDQLAKFFMEQLKADEVSSGIISNIRQFLKDNGISCEEEISEAMGKLRESVKDNAPKFDGKELDLRLVRP